MRPWWWRSVSACLSVLVLAGLVAAVSFAVGADRRVALAADAPVAAKAADADSPPQARPPGSPELSEPGPLVGRPRTDEARAGASLAIPAGWRAVPRQDLVTVAPGRFPTTLVLGDTTVVLLGALDPARVPGSGDTPALEREARRLVTVFADALAPDGTRVVTMSDVADRVDGRPAWTSLRRIEAAPEPSGADTEGAPDIAPAPADIDGALVRISAVAGPAGPPRGLVALSVAFPGPGLAGRAGVADDVIRSLRLAPPDAAADRSPATEPPSRDR